MRMTTTCPTSKSAEPHPGETMPSSQSLFESRTLTGMLLHQAERSADKVALTIVGEDLTYADLVERSNAMARGLRQLGIGRADVVAVLTENCADQVVIQFATARLRAVEVMLNTAYKGDFLAHQLRMSGAGVIVVDSALAGNVLDVVDQLPELRHVVLRGAADLDLPESLTVSDIAGLRAHDGSALDLEDPLWSDPSTITFTSGTTGPSK